MAPLDPEVQRKSNLILGCVYGCPKIDPFLESLRNLSVNTGVVLFASGLSARDLTACQHAGVRLVPFVSVATGQWSGKAPSWRSALGGALSLRRFLLRHSRPTPGTLAVAKLALHPNHSRFLHYRDYLRDFATQAQRIFLTDVRDVVFQRDPFDFPADSPVLAFCEEPANRLGTEKYNRRFMLDAFGRRVLNELAAQVVICAGTIAGGRAAMLEYLDLFCSLTLQHPAKPGADQALHNVIIRRNLVSSTVVSNRAGLVLTLDGMTQSDLAFDSEHRLVDASGAPFAALHMFDRVPAADAAVRAQFGLPPLLPT